MKWEYERIFKSFWNLQLNLTEEFYTFVESSPEKTDTFSKLRDFIQQGRSWGNESSDCHAISDELVFEAKFIGKVYW